MNMKEVRGLGHLMVCVFLYQLSVFVVVPAITDVMMGALCPGRGRCGLAIYLTGFQQAIVGLGSMIATPLIGNLSDKYGRKALLTLPMTLNVIPQVVLVWGRSRNLVYAYYTLTTLVGIVCKGSMNCLTLAYVADKVAERRRASAFGVVSGTSAAGFVAGTLVARFVPAAATFQVSAAVGLVAAAYMRAFLIESVPSGSPSDELSQPIIEGSSGKKEADRILASALDMIRLVTSSTTFSQAAVIAFFCSFSDSGLYESLLYFLKAQFLFSKDQFADLLLIIGIAGMFSQLVLTPIVVPRIGEKKMLSIALLASCVHIFLYSVAWDNWVPYFAAMFVIASVFAQPCLRSIVSNNVGPGEQGMAQGCISGIASFANILAPLVITPLTALFLSDNPPFNFPGFSIMCIGFASMAAFVQSIMMMRVDPQVLNCKVNTSQHAIP